MADTCCCCGGSASLGGTQHPIPGSVPSLRYCSMECHDDWEDYLARQAEWRASDWCPSCGFDNHEHADDCPTRAGATSLSFGSIGPK
jgi:hypothetical protein